MKISVIITNYNYGKWLRRCIRSLLNQNFDSYEIIIVDDLSTDNSRNILLEYENNPKIKDKQLAKLGRLIESNLIDIGFNDYDNMEYKDENLFYELHKEDDPFYQKKQDNICYEDEKKYLNALNNNQQQIIDDDDDW